MVWIAASAAFLAIVVVNPKITRSRCNGHWVDSPALWLKSAVSDKQFGQDLCGVDTYPLAERDQMVAGAVVGNGVALVLWRITGRAKSPPSN